MKQIKLLTVLCCMLCSFTVVTAQEYRTETGILFRQGQSVIDPDFADNRKQLTSVVELLDSVINNQQIEIRNIEFCGAVSPEGNSEFNRNLSNDRLKALEAYVRGRLKVPDDVVSYNDHYIPWDKLAQSIESSNMEHKEEVLKVIRQEVPDAIDHQGNSLDGRIPILKGMYDGEVWAVMLRDHFRELRNAYVVLVTYVYREEQPAAAEPVEEAEPADQAVPTGLISPITAFETSDPITLPEEYAEAIKQEQPHHIYLKTNVIGLGMLMANLSLEFDFAKHWSAQLPIYYSGINYFCETVKFRNFTVQPEIRYWFSGNTNDKFFVGAHFGFSYYNFAFGGDYRSQDKDGKTPAIGGGVNVGYRMPLCKNGRWKVEFSLGAGVYPLHYDKFLNEHNGEWSHSEKKTYFGLDHAAVSFAYMLNLNKKSK